ncbi:6-phospho-beta-glucosidase [Nakamurella sp. UYEF19]|uniref:family 4 glycosyl hydrolase n=1 Tax=Nakamurella sp. UYEF19 TaxID=1756392 RepID=UPI003391BE87
MRLVILGGGGFRVPLVYRALIRRPWLGIDEVVLYDVDLARLAVVAAVLEPTPGVRILCTDSLTEALTGADVVFSAIRVGGAAGRVRDERRALDLGVLGQETVGAGGLSFGLRTLPVALQAARLQAELAPDSWLINFTNPAGLITQALSDVLGPRVIGICDSPIGLVRRACRALEIDPERVEYDYAGINHLGWLTGLRQDGRDLLPDLLCDDALLARTEEGRLFDPQLLRSLHAVPNEYLYFYYAAREVTAALAGSATRGEVVLAEQDEFYRVAGGDGAQAAELWQRARQHREETYLAEARQEDRDEGDLTGGGYEEVALDIAQAVLSGRPAELIVNARNGSTIPQLPESTVIETRCQVDATGAHPLPLPTLGLHQLGLIASVRASELGIIEAAVTGHREAAIHAFAIHPLIGSRQVAADLVTSIEADEPAVAALLGA